MSRVHDANIPISSAFESLMVNDEADRNIFATPMGDDTDTEPLILKDGAVDAGNNNTNRTKIHPKTHLRVAGANRTLRRSTSDLVLDAQARRSNSSIDSQITTVANNQAKNEKRPDTSPYPSDALLQPARRFLRHSSSNSRIESRSRYHDPTIDSATLKRQLTNQTHHSGQVPVKPWRVRPARTSNGPFRWIDPRSPKPGFKWFPRSKSDSASIPQASKNPHRNKVPLKSSMRKSKSAATTPPSEVTTIPASPEGIQPLRRVKTVDFEDAVSKKLDSLPSRKLWSREHNQEVASEEDECKGLMKKEKGTKEPEINKAPSFPNPITVKSKAADPAVTRTDVHVVAIAPCWRSEETFDEGGIDPTTPTMQIVESKSGCFEVIWDDIPVESNICLRRSSSPSQAPDTIGSTASRSLERVNSKLTEWTVGGGVPESFKAEVVVFPDDDGRSASREHAPDHEDALSRAPPNSTRTSASQSHFNSRSTSVRPSRTASSDNSDDSNDTDGLLTQNDIAKASEVVATLPLLDLDMPSEMFKGYPKTKQAASPRKLSNIEESELKFRGHRDSVALAYTRVLRSGGGISPELFKHRDSVSMARKRMHSRNHAVSQARPIPSLSPASFPASEGSFMPIGVRDESVDMPSPPTVKEHATKALKSSTSASMLRPQPAGSKRHIRIVE
ncbi:hypothetical protein CC80DRAFT_494462 [Byssothecium circinans]|uniref:Uncharacterized protein n=1 Tax=Byssothecium circinans TaxID=147558 RepID=A0A6A5TME3_9PLEO|nr:hypothetical protein CC80DRAFT_494462 [Byssothecium circinans]